MNDGPLKGVRVTEFTTAWAGPYASCLLGFLGAEVIKVESRQRIDHARMLAFSTGKRFTGPNSSSVFNTLNLNKASITLNLKKPKAVELAKKLLEVSDCTMENMRPGVLERLGLGYEVVERIKPDIVYLSSSACGQTGPEREYIGYAPTFAAMAGLSYLTGYDDWPPSNFMGSIDLKSAATSAFAILAALCHRQRTGKGQHIDLASQEAIAAMSGDVFMDYILNQRVPQRKGNQHEVMAPHNCYRCRGEDQWISIAVATNEEWEALCHAMGMPDLAADKRFSDGHLRWENQEELDTIITQWTEGKDNYAVMEALQQAGIAATPSLSGEGLFRDPHLRARNVFTQVDHPEIGTDWAINPPWRLSETPATIRRHAPLLGEHNTYVFCDLLGLSGEEVAALETEQVIY
jgi:benzylsuccinate CoA-transferase BbsF subunit